LQRWGCRALSLLWMSVQAVSGMGRVDDDFSVVEDPDDWRILNGPDHYNAAEKLLRARPSPAKAPSCRVQWS